MKEIQEILKKLKSLEQDEKAVLATVVDVQGSSYRLPGAKMLVLENGDTYGTVSGGCLEADVLERAKRVLETGEPQIFIYDTTVDADSVFSLNMGCRGIIRILLEPVSRNSLLEFIEGCLVSKQNGLAATLIKSAGDESIGTRLLLSENGAFQTDFSDARFQEIAPAAQQVLSAGRSELRGFEFGEVFFDYLALPVRLTIFGAGADAVPLTDIASGLGWHVTVVDHRAKYANRERFGRADQIIISRPEETSGKVALAEIDVAVIMTHNYAHDKEILQTLLTTDARYIGKLGPKRRSANMLREFEEEGLELNAAHLRRFYSPVGLDIGADTPEAIALSIVAEIQSVLKQRPAGFLRNRTGSIYGRD